MVTYYAAFIPDLVTITAPLRTLLCKNKSYRWSAQCEAAFTQLKNEITSERVLTVYNPDAPLTLATDASLVGVAAVLSQETDGYERPIAYTSRSLSLTERHYSQLDREL